MLPSFPKYTTQVMRYHNILVMGAGQFAFALKEENYQFSFISDDLKNTDDLDFVLTFMIAEESYHLLFQSSFLENYFKKLFPDLNLLKLNAALRHVLVNLISEPILEALKQNISDNSIVLTEAHFSLKSKERTKILLDSVSTFPFKISSSDDSAHFRGVISTASGKGADFILKELDAALVLKQEAVLLDASKLYLPVVFYLGHQVFSAEMFKSLRVGDVCLLPVAHFVDQEELVAYLKTPYTPSYNVTLSDQSMIINKKMEPSMIQDGDNDDELFNFDHADIDESEDFQKLQELMEKHEDDKANDEVNDEKGTREELNPHHLTEKSTEYASAEKEVEKPSEDFESEPKALDVLASSNVILKNADFKLSFLIASQKISFETLSKLKPGFQMDLQEPVANVSVSILANDKLFAKGRLVQIEDRLGVEITNLLVGKK